MGFLKEIGINSLGMPYLLMGLFVVLFLFVIFMAWCLLPFATFGIKDRLEELIAEQKKTNNLLEQSLERKTLDGEKIFANKRSF